MFLNVCWNLVGFVATASAALNLHEEAPSSLGALPKSVLIFVVLLLAGVTKDDVLKSAALAAKWKEPPRDALDTLVLLNSGLDLNTLDQYEQVGGVLGWSWDSVCDECS
jgi:hypothetical protein